MKAASNTMQEFAFSPVGRPVSAASRVSRSVITLLAALLLVAAAPLLPSIPAQAAGDPGAEVPSNVAPLATTSASYVPSWNRTAALNDGTSAFSGHQSVWGTYGNFAPSHWAEYTWQWPVTVDRAVVWFWNDEPDPGNVRLPSGWHVEYLDDVGAWQPVAGTPGAVVPATSAVSAPHEVVFAAVTTTALRLTLDAQPNAATFYALGATEWQVWGSGGVEPVVPVDPSAPLATEAVVVRTTPGQAPALPSVLWVLPENGPLTYVSVTWDAVAPSSFAATGTFTVAGRLDGDRVVQATVHVVDDLASPVTSIEYAATVTVPGTPPVCPATVTVTRSDGTHDSTVSVIWDTIDPADYATAENIVDVAGTVDSYAPGAVCTVIVLAAVDPTDLPPLITLTVDSAPSATGWYTSSPTFTIGAQAGGSPVETVEYRVGAGAWTAYTEPVTLTSEGQVSIEARATDIQGRSASRSRDLRVDTVAPVTTVDHVSDGTRVEFALAPSDPEPGSGLSRTLFSYGLSADPTNLQQNAMWATYENPFSITLEKDAHVYVHVHSQDVAGQQEVTQTIELPFAAPPPGAPVLDSATFVPGLPASGWYTEVPGIHVEATTPDGGSTTTEISVDGGRWTAAVEKALDGLLDGTRAVGVRVVNSAETASGIVQLTLPLDRTAPSVVPVLNLESLTLSFESHDDTSGVASTEYRTEGGWVVYDEPVVVTHGLSIEFRGIDLAGNVSAVGSVTVPTEETRAGDGALPVTGGGAVTMGVLAVLLIAAGAVLSVRRRTAMEESDD